MVSESGLRKRKLAKRSSAILSFTLTGQDAVGFSGKIIQAAVPLPAAALLFGSGLLGLASVLRKKLSLT